MKSKIGKLLLPFYFGSISESDRLQVERELLLDTEVLVDFLDLKRNLECEPLCTPAPSAQVWSRLSIRAKLQKRPKFFLSVGLAVAASLIIFFIYWAGDNSSAPTSSSINQFLFDSSSELPANSNVL